MTSPSQRELWFHNLFLFPSHRGATLHLAGEIWLRCASQEEMKHWGTHCRDYLHSEGGKRGVQ
jgi:hypothetical protein